MSKRPFQIDDQQVPPIKYRKTVPGAKAPVINGLQNPTPEKSRIPASTSTTASKPDPYYEIPDKYALVETVRTLGTGGQARAVLVRTGGEYRVAKFFKKEKYCIREARIIRQIHASASNGDSDERPESHPHIVSLIDGPFNNFPGALTPADGSKEWTILLDFCEGNTLTHCKNEYLRQSRSVPEMLIWKYFLQIAEALAFLHWGYGTDGFDPDNPYERKYSFVHRDLKPCNILRTSSTSEAAATNAASTSTTTVDPYPDIQLCDFGMSAKVTKLQFQEARTGGSEYWQPPEQCQAPNLAGPAQDIWALGAVIHFLALGEPPCDATKGDESQQGAEWRASLPRKVTKISSKPTERVGSFKNMSRTEFSKADMEKKWGGCYSRLLNHYMQRCLLFDVSKRATAIEIVQDLGAIYQEVVEKCKGNLGGFAKRVRNMVM